MNKSLRAVALQPFVLTTAITNTRHEYARLSTFTHDGTTSWYRQQQRSQSDGLRASEASKQVADTVSQTCKFQYFQVFEHTGTGAAHERWLQYQVHTYILVYRLTKPTIPENDDRKLMGMIGPERVSCCLTNKIDRGG